MSSLITGFEYDIFISYRQKDNKHDGWVTEFVRNLKGELESTFKDEISVYFDINPHDGLLETHDVGASLKEKLKCLIFIPIISQTYCDPKSFAWQYEFVAFNKLVKEDQFGRDIRLASGNIASRILPVRIHELDSDDSAFLENELGGILRSIDFIFRSAGVNRPLKPDDIPEKNLNNTYYRDQINKVANAVKDIIYSLKKFSKKDPYLSQEQVRTNTYTKKKIGFKSIIVPVAVIALLITGFFIIPKLIKSSGDSEELEKTLAVLPFRNLSNDSTQDYFCDGFMDEILNNLQGVKEFTVRSRISSDQYKKSDKTLSTIGKEMKVNYIVQGSVGRDNNNLKIWIQLTNAKTDENIWAKDYVREIKQIFTLQSEIAKEIAKELKTVLTFDDIERIDKKPTKNLEAYNYYLLGKDYQFQSFNKQNYEIAIKMYRRAIDLDPDFALAYINISQCYLQLHWFHYDKSEERVAKAKEAIDAAITIDPDLPELHVAQGNYYYIGFLDYSNAIKQLEIAQQESGNNPDVLYTMANIYRRAGEWELSDKYYLMAHELDPVLQVINHNLGVNYSMKKDYLKAEEYFNKALSINPAFIEAIWQKCFMYLKSEGDTFKARQVLVDAFQLSECKSSPLLFESAVLIDIYENKYQEALSFLSVNDINFITVQFYINLKSLLCARVYDLMNKQSEADKYYNSALITLDSMIIKNPEDSRLYSALGIAYAGIGMKEKAIEAGRKGVDMMSISKEAYRGVFRTEDLARIYVMVGEYEAALEQIKLLLTIPSRLSVNLLLLDPAWKPLWNLPELKRIIKSSSEK